MYYDPESAMLICTTIYYDKDNPQNSYCMLTFSGAIGGTGTPAAFEVLMRPVTRKIQSEALGVVDRYVDDFDEFGTPLHVKHDKALVHTTNRSLLGKDAIQTSKDFLSEAEDLLAFHLNLTRGEIRPKQKAFDKLTFLFFTFDMNISHHQKVYQCFTSLTHYYAKAIRGMESFIQPFRDMIRRSGTGNLTAIPIASCKFAIEMWRTALYLIHIDKESLSIPIDIFYLQNNPDLESTDPECINMSDLILQGDAGTDQLAVAIYDNKTNNLIVWTTYKLPYPKWENKYQHTYYEYLVLMLSQILMYILFPSKDNKIATFQFRGDNTAVLAWATKHSCNSKSSQNACIIANELQTKSNILMIKPQFISGIDMGDVDKASRNKWQESLTPETYLHIQDDKIINQIFKITNPYITTQHLPDQHAVYLEIHAIISKLKHYNF
jgi:hypothetical protein